MAQFEPWMIPIIAGVPLAFTFQVVQYKLKKKELEMRGSDAELRPEVDALRDDLDNTQAQLAEIQERLDFAERLLTDGRESQDEKSK